MKFSVAWLQSFLDKKIDEKQLVTQLTSAGLEVDSSSPVASTFEKIVVAEIVSVEQHPNAEKLKVCQVNIGTPETITIVTNVKSVYPGLKVPAALLGAQLPDGLKIQKTALRGVESQGMFCGAETLGLGEAAPGLFELPADAPVGEDLRQYLNLDDTTIEVELTPNRGDCLSIMGIAREAALANNCEVKNIKINQLPDDIKKEVEVKVTADQACPRYLARIIQGINSQAVTPIWMQEALRRSGVRCIHPVVDVTNYVMLELGQPMHAFDAARVEKNIEVRFAHANEKLLLLNGQEIILTPDVLVIADAHQPLAMAGIMGGMSSSVTAATQNILLESAFFMPLAIMGKARQYGLHTDSSHRFERGVDPELPLQAMQRATELLIEIVGGKLGPITEQVNAAALPMRHPITVRQERVTQLLGCAIPADKIENIFNNLGMKIKSISNGWEVVAPTYRFDIAIEEDLVEEVARIYGYDNIAAHTPSAKIQIQAQQPNYHFVDLLCNLDYQEAISYSFVAPKILKLLTPDIQSLSLQNPISPELSALRTTLWAGLLLAAQHNVNRQQARVRLFEQGLRFVQNGTSLQQTPSLAGLILGSVMPEQWGVQPARAVDFYDLKADVEAILAQTGQQFEFQSAQHTALHPGRCAEILHQGQVVGVLGALHPQIQQQLDLPTVYLFELDLLLLQSLMMKPLYQEVSKFPAVRRDIALVMAEELAIADICNLIRKEAGNLLKDLVIFDIYRGQNIAPAHKSVALGLILQAIDRTLSDEEINGLIKKIVDKLKDSYQAILRE